MLLFKAFLISVKKPIFMFHDHHSLMLCALVIFISACTGIKQITLMLSHPSHLSVCLSVCDVVAPYSDRWTFRQYFLPFDIRTRGLGQFVLKLWENQRDSTWSCKQNWGDMKNWRNSAPGDKLTEHSKCAVVTIDFVLILAYCTAVWCLWWHYINSNSTVLVIILSSITNVDLILSGEKYWILLIIIIYISYVCGIFTVRRICIAQTMPSQYVRLSVCHTPVLSVNDYTYPQNFSTIR